MVLFDIQILLILLGIIISGFMFPANPYGPSLFGIVVGVLFLLSRKLKNALYVSKVIYWISTHIFKPKTKINHIIWGWFFLIIGVFPYSKPPSESEKQFFHELHKSMEYWVLIVFFIVFNLLVGFFTYWQNRKKLKEKDGDGEGDGLK